MEKEQIEKLKELVQNIDFDSFNQSLIKDNKIVFVYESNVYRCKMPSQKSLAIVEDRENRLKIKYLRDGEYLSKNNLKKLLKESQGIDIDALENKKLELKEKLQKLYLDIATTHTSEEKHLDELRLQKEDIEIEFRNIVVEITENLKGCIEEQLKKKYYEYLTYLCTEKCLENDEWVKIWDSEEEFQNDESGLPLNAIANLQTLMLNVRD